MSLNLTSARIHFNHTSSIFLGRKRQLSNMPWGYKFSCLFFDPIIYYSHFIKKYFLKKSSNENFEIETYFLLFTLCLHMLSSYGFVTWLRFEQFSKVNNLFLFPTGWWKSKSKRSTTTPAEHPTQPRDLKSSNSFIFSKFQKFWI